MELEAGIETKYDVLCEECDNGVKFLVISLKIDMQASNNRNSRSYIKHIVIMNKNRPQDTYTKEITKSTQTASARNRRSLTIYAITKGNSPF